jgi:hypothetical protein
MLYRPKEDYMSSHWGLKPAEYTHIERRPYLSIKNEL